MGASVLERSDPDDVKDMLAAVSALQKGICGSVAENGMYRVDPCEAFKRNSANAQKLRSYFESRNTRVMFGYRAARMRSICRYFGREDPPFSGMDFSDVRLG